MKQHMTQHRNKFFIFMAILMVFAFLYWAWPVKKVGNATVVPASPEAPLLAP